MCLYCVGHPDCKCKCEETRISREMVICIECNHVLKTTKSLYEWNEPKGLKKDKKDVN